MPQKKDATLWLWLGCGGVLVLGAGIAYLVLIGSSVRSSEPYQHGLERARGDVRVQEALGTPIERGWSSTGSTETENGDLVGYDMTISLKGSKQSGVLHVIGKKVDGRWTYTKMQVTPSSGPPIDLLNAGRASARPGAG